jgi:hypothetical protein
VVWISAYYTFSLEELQQLETKSAGEKLKNDLDSSLKNNPAEADFSFPHIRPDGACGFAF